MLAAALTVTWCRRVADHNSQVGSCYDYISHSLLDGRLPLPVTRSSFSRHRSTRYLLSHVFNITFSTISGSKYEYIQYVYTCVIISYRNSQREDGRTSTDAHSKGSRPAFATRRVPLATPPPPSCFERLVLSVRKLLHLNTSERDCRASVDSFDHHRDDEGIH